MTEKVPASLFDHLELTNALVVLMMTSVSCDANTHITQPKSHIAPCFSHLHLAKNGAADSVISIMFCSHCFQQDHMTKRVMSHIVSIVFT